VAGDRILLHVADAVLVLALGPCPIRRTGTRPESPIARKGVQPLVEHDLARHRIVANDQRLGIVEQDLAGHSTEVAERPFQALEPSGLALVAERRNETAARVAQRRHEQIDPRHLFADLDERRAEVDLQLPARRCLEAHARPRLGKQIAAHISHRPLDRP
jgi:hypothetical protein